MRPRYEAQLVQPRSMVANSDRDARRRLQARRRVVREGVQWVLFVVMLLGIILFVSLYLPGQPGQS